jgi:hypothetical protein
MNNMVYNAGFEALPAGTDWLLTNAVTLTGQTPSGNGGTTGSHTGQCCIQLTSGAVAKCQQGSSGTSGLFECQAGQVYNCSIWYRGGSGVGDTLQIYFNTFNAAGIAVNVTSPSYTAVSGWTQENFQFVVSNTYSGYTAGSAVSFNVLVRAPINSANFFIDDITLTQAPGTGNGTTIDGSGNVAVNPTGVLGFSGNQLQMSYGSDFVSVGGQLRLAAGPSTPEIISGAFAYTTAGGTTSGNPTQGPPFASNVLALATTLSSAYNGWLVVGPGIVPGTLVSSAGGTAFVTLSQNANNTTPPATATQPVTYYFVNLPAPAGAYTAPCILFNTTNGRSYLNMSGFWVDQGDAGTIIGGIFIGGAGYFGSVSVAQLSAGTANFAGTVTFQNGSGPYVAITSTDVIISNGGPEVDISASSVVISSGGGTITFDASGVCTFTQAIGGTTTISGGSIACVNVELTGNTLVNGTHSGFTGTLAAAIAAGKSVYAGIICN